MNSSTLVQINRYWIQHLEVSAHDDYRMQVGDPPTLADLQPTLAGAQV